MSIDVNFFRSRVKDECNYEGASMAAGNNTMRGNLCAYVEGETRVWACAASDTMCWTFSQDCSGDETQRQCSRNGYDWCCRAYETCTEMAGQINVCWGPWDNPNENLSAPDALVYNQEHYPVLPSLSTASAIEPAATQSSTASNSSPAESTTPSGSSATESSAASSPSPSLGSIIGIGVGCGVAGAALAAGIGFLLLRRRRRGVAPGSAQQSDQPDMTRAHRLELSSERIAEIGNGRVNEEVSELPGCQKLGRYE